MQGNAASESMQAVPGSGVSLANFFKTNKILGYGSVEGKAQYQFAVSKGNWEVAVKNLVNSVLDKTPILPW